jgi:hypothetical protein
MKKGTNQCEPMEGNFYTEGVDYIYASLKKHIYSNSVELKNSGATKLVFP